MIEEGIEDGDYVIFKHQAVVKQGEIAVVRIDGPWESGSTVKKYYKHDTTIRLKAANPQYQPQELIFKDGDPTIAILGKAVVVVSFRPSGTGS
jgi:SOS-response transcriptional repressor LexA